MAVVVESVVHSFQVLGLVITKNAFATRKIGSPKCCGGVTPISSNRMQMEQISQWMISAFTAQVEGILPAV